MMDLRPFDASLDPPESNPQAHQNRTPPADLDWDDCSSFRHSGWRADRERVHKALWRTQQPFTVQYDFRTCGIYAYVLRSIDDPDRYRVAGSSCHNRFCVPCARERSRAIASNIVAHLNGKPARFLTLTLRSTTEPLKALLDKLQDCFSRLRRRKIWRKRVKGGVSFIELKWNDQLQRWNVHLHCIVTGLFMKQSLLSKEWKAITSDSMIVDIRFVKDEARLAQYVTKYASKPLSHCVLHDPAKLDEAIVALKGRRLATTFGTWRGLLLTPKPDKESWINLGSLREMISSAAAGDAESARILTCLTVPFADSGTRTSPSRAPPALGNAVGDRQEFLLLLTPMHRDPVD